MNLEHYKAASEATDADERALIPGFKRTRPVDREAQRDAWDEKAEHDNDLRQESLQAEREEHLREAWLDQRHLHDERDQ